MTVDVENDRRAPAPVRVARGAKLLDERQPGWHDLVDPLKLDIASSRRCVIAQAYGGSFRRGLNELDPDYVIDITAHGFNDRPFSGDKDAIEAAWTAEINRRRYGKDTPPLRQRVRRFVYDTLRALGYR